MNNEQNLNIPHPDPAWDYYTTWNSLIGVQSKIKQALDQMKEIENATRQTDEQIRQIIYPAWEILIAINNELANDLPEDYDNDDDED